MKHTSSRFATILSLAALTSFLLTPAAFARTPYNALAKKLKANTTQGVFNPSSDSIQKDTRVKGIVWGLNGSTFLVRMANDDAGYNILITKDTIITVNGKAATKKSLTKGKTVTVIGDLDTSTYTLSAKTVELGSTTTVSSSQASEEKPLVEKSEQNEPITKQSETKENITKNLRRGSRDVQVKILQDKLVGLGLLTAEGATGYYGSLTEKAVKAFQKSHGLDQVGYLGPKTISLLNQ